jgi:hypothetical protein
VPPRLVGWLLTQLSPYLQFGSIIRKVKSKGPRNALQDVASLLATNRDDGVIRGIVSVVGQEGEQNGFYRSLLGEIPSALPFLTTSTPEFAFSALNQNFVVPGSYPNIGEINLPIFQALNVGTQNIQPTSQTLEFSVSIGYNYGNPLGNYYSSLSLVYINQQNLPIVEEITDIYIEGDTITFHANFSFDQCLMNGLTIAAVAKTTGPFASADAVAKDASSAWLNRDQLKGSFCICGLGAGEFIGFCDT